MAIDNKIIPCHWQATFYVKPSLKESEIIELFDHVECESRPFEFQVIGKGNGKKTQVTIDYMTNKFDEVSPNSKSEYEYAEETKAREYALFIRNLMLERMIYQRVFSHLEVEKVNFSDDTGGSVLRRTGLKTILTNIAARITKNANSSGDNDNPKLLNKEELKNAVLLKKRPVGSSIVSKYNILDVGDSLAESHHFWEVGISKEVNGKAKDESMIYAIAELLQLAKTVDDDIMRFILTWNAFNWLYAHFNVVTKNKKTKQRDMFKTVIRSLDQNEMNYIKQYLTSDRLDNLISYNILRGKGDKEVDVSKELEFKLKNSAPDFEIITSVLTCIYGVRNQIFHEGPTSRTLTSEELVKRAKICNSILMPAVTTCLKNFVNYES